MKINKFFPGCVVIAAFLFNATALLANVETEHLEPLPVHRDTTRNVVDALTSRHYVDTALDDDLSEKTFEGYLEDLDPSKSYLLASDIEEFEKYRYRLDNALRKGELTPAYEIFNRYHERVIARLKKVIHQLETGIDRFDFTKDEVLELEREEAPWAASEDELDELWRKRIKHSILNLKLADKKSDEIQELLLKRYKNRLDRTRQTNSEDVYQLYMNAFTRTYDPHTQYFSPRTSENFNINMSLSLEGIGAVLQREDEYTKVVSLVPAGPAAKAGTIQPNDKIIAVGQGVDGDMVDVVGWRLDEVVQLIRGEKGTVVKLDIVPANAKTAANSRSIQITRNKVELEEQTAQSKILEIDQYGHKHKIGVIDIPTFYIDFEARQSGKKDYRSTTRDVKKLLMELKEENVEGVVIDLRDNGGGSLQEAKTLTGLFIDQGPTVQIRTKSNRVDVLNDRDVETVYDGPLAILVNRLSASASEIFAGAIQDYERGIIIGNQTFGKGTVQSLLPLNRGQLKLTQAKFYRISGDSTQHRGIIPDVSLPQRYDPEAIGESTLDGPLPWDKIKATDYRRRNSIDGVVSHLQDQHKEREATKPELRYMREAIEYRRKLGNQTVITLNEEKRIQEREEEDVFWLALENKKRKALGKEPLDSLDELDDGEQTLANLGTSGPGFSSANNSENTGDSEDENATDSDDSAEADNELNGNEVAGVIDESSEQNSDANKEASSEEQNEDALLMESGTILLDYIAATSRTVEKSSKDRGNDKH